MFKAFFFSLIVTALGGVGYLQTQISLLPTENVLGAQTTTSPTVIPTTTPEPSHTPTPSVVPTDIPVPTIEPAPTQRPTTIPTKIPTPTPTVSPTSRPTSVPTATPGPTHTPTPSTTPTPIITTLPTLAPTLTQTPTPTITIVVATSEQINGFINQYASEYRLDPNVIRHIALCESGFNPSAKNLTYAGLFQFSPGTWTSYRNKMNKDPNPDLRVDAEEAVRTAAYVLSLNKGSIWPNCMP